MQSLKVTKGERAKILRRRKRQNQRERAEELGMTRHQYQALEADQAMYRGKTKPKAITLKDHEWCALMRWRDPTWSQYAIGLSIDCSRVWVNRMENGLEDPSRLVAFWWRQQ